jgi:hypothetical protein
LTDWIDEFMYLTEGIRSPESFRLWTAITTISSVLERRVWIETDQDRLYPNMYTILSGGPASGKTLMVTFAKRLLAKLAGPVGIFLGPDNPSPAAFLDYLEKSTKMSINGMGMDMYSAMSVMCMELGVLISKYDKDFVANLTTLYDNPDTFDAPRRVSKSINVEAPTVNILAAATPDAIGDIIPESAWGQGFTSRLVFIYGTAPEQTRHIFKKRKNVDVSSLEIGLKEMYDELHGEVEWEPPAQTAMETWFNIEKMAPVPTYGRLVNYKGRRDVHIMKLAMISAAAGGHGQIVTEFDFRRAQKWLFEAEETMPDVFRAMAQKSDTQLLQDAHHTIYVKYNNIDEKQRKPISDRELWKVFEDKCPHDKISSLITAMEKTGRIRRSLLPGEWIPNPL